MPMVRYMFRMKFAIERSEGCEIDLIGRVGDASAVLQNTKMAYLSHFLRTIITFNSASIASQEARSTLDISLAGESENGYF